ncbi:MAG: hypothetical protein MJK04_01625 [Psychrosphaera sp.]|nr:hypothetical protein [Psychrosphaera sp.]
MNLQRVGSIGVLLMLLILAFGARSWVPYQYVFAQPEQTRLLGVDPFFHLRQSKTILDQFPHIDRWDHGTHFPKGIPNDATGLFDVAIAAATIIVYGPNATINEVATVAAWFSPILALLACICLYLLASSLLGRGAGLVAVACYILYPGDALDRTLLGFADHHSAEAFLALAITLGLVQLFKRNNRPWWQPAFICASPFIALAYTWKGAALFMPITGFCLLLYCTFALATGVAPKHLAQAIIRYGLALLMAFIALHFIWPELALFTTGMIWLSAGAAGIALGGWGYLSLLRFFSQKYPRTAVAFGGFFVVITLVGLILLLTPIGQKIAKVMFGARDALILEQSVVTTKAYFELLGSVGLLALPGLVIGLWMAFKKRWPLEVIFPIGMAGMWLSLWWQTGDFDYTVVAFIAFGAMLTLYAVLERLNVNLSGGAITVAAVAVLILPIYPFKWSVTPWIDQAKLSSLIIYEDAWYQATNWMREHTPQQQDYGVMSSWEFGNIIAAYDSGTPMWSRFASSKVPKWTFAQSEQQSLQWLCPKCAKDKKGLNHQQVKYAVVDAKTYGPYFYAKTQYVKMPISTVQNGHFDVKGKPVPHINFGKFRENSMINRLYGKNGNELSHYRLVFESSALSYNAAFLQLFDQGKYDYRLHVLPINSPQEKQQYSRWVKADVVTTSDGYLYDDQIESSIKIFEIVPGETISGTTEPGATVQARLELTSTNNPRTLRYTRTGVADKNGQYSLIVPYPTGPADSSTSVVAEQPYQVFIQLPGEGGFVFDKAVDIVAEGNPRIYGR